MSEALAIPEKHDGALADRSSVRLWLRLLSCTMTIEKEVQRRFAARGATLPRFDVLAALDRNPEGLTMGALSRALLVPVNSRALILHKSHRSSRMNAIHLTREPREREERETLA